MRKQEKKRWGLKIQFSLKSSAEELRRRRRRMVRRNSLNTDKDREKHEREKKNKCEGKSLRFMKHFVGWRGEENCHALRKSRSSF